MTRDNENVLFVKVDSVMMLTTSVSTTTWMLSVLPYKVIELITSTSTAVYTSTQELHILTVDITLRENTHQHGRAHG